MPSKKASLSTFALVMITIVSVDNIRNLPATALFGSSLIFFFLVSALFFLVPAALTSAELASGWPKQGGVYVWVKEAFGEDFGFLAIWLQWIENVIWYPTILSFVAGTLGYLIAPHLASDRWFLMTVILVVFWGATLLNLWGMKASALFSTFCSIFGLILPMLLIIGLGVVWVYTGQHTAIHFAPHDLLPNLSQKNLWVSLTGIMLSFCGIEIATVHARDVKNPQKSFPRALLYSTLIIVLTLIFGSLSIALVLPAKDIGLITGIMQAFDAFFTAYHMHWILPLAVAMLVIAGVGGVSNWIIAPTAGIVVASKDVALPQWVSYENQHGAPSGMLMCQALIVSALTLVFFLIPTVNGSYWLLTALAAQLYMLMYILMFVACVWLRYKQPQVDRLFKIPGGKPGVWLCAALGITACLTTLCVGFFPPEQINVGGVGRYSLLILSGLVIMTLPPFCFSAHAKRKKA